MGWGVVSVGGMLPLHSFGYCDNHLHPVPDTHHHKDRTSPNLSLSTITGPFRSPSRLTQAVFSMLLVVVVLLTLSFTA